MGGGEGERGDGLLPRLEVEEARERVRREKVTRVERLKSILRRVKGGSR